MHFDLAKTKLRFSIFGLSHSLHRGSEVTVGSVDPLQYFLKGHNFVREGSSGTRFDHGQFKIKTFPIYAPPHHTTALTGQQNSTGKHEKQPADFHAFS